MAVSLASGDVSSGAIGTVSYVDGDRVWGFGHPLDVAGRRSLFLQDAYVYAVINNPIGSPDLQTYKYASPGHDVGTLTNDANAAVVGRLGVLPTRFPLKVTAKDLDTGALQVAQIQIADETPLGLPTGVSALTDVGSVAVAEVASNALHGSPVRQSGSMCVRVTVREARKPLRFCNTYAGGTTAAESGDVGGGPLVNDFVSAASLLDAFNFGPLHVTGAEVYIKLRRSLRLAYLRSAKAPGVVRRGRRIAVKLSLQRQNGPKLSRTVRLKVPKGTSVGEHRLVFTGTAADLQSSPEDGLAGLFDVTSIDEGAGEEDGTDTGGPKTVAALAKAFAAIHRYDGVTAEFRPAAGGAAGQHEHRVYRDADLRIAGRATARVLVLP
jgi:hypothetical protein